MWIFFDIDIDYHAVRMVVPEKETQSRGSLLLPQLSAWKEFLGHMEGAARQRIP